MLTQAEAPMEQYESSTYYSTSASDSSADTGFVLAMLGVTLVIVIVIYAINAFLLGKVFKKAGVESWKAWVPIYNNWILLELGDQKGWLALISLIPGAGIITAIFMYIAMYYIGLKLQKEGWFIVVAIFVPTVWMAWLAFDKSVWQDGQANLPQQPPVVPPTTPQPQQPIL